MKKEKKEKDKKKIIMLVLASKSTGITDVEK